MACKMKFEICPEINQLVGHKINSDAFVIKQEGKADERKKQSKIALKQRLKRSLRLKPIERDTTDIMNNFTLHQTTVTLNAEDEDNQPESDQESSDGGFGRKNWHDRRFAKDSPVLRQDIISLFEKRSVWTWDQIKDANSD